ncbi:hypothetical protein MKW92_034329 [Papaver armeniacum]|nr:hypothetical protein MKW92_034329 [Papaver armeniacum]
MASLKSMFFCFFLFVLIAMPAASSASRTLLQSDTCPRVPTSSPSCRGVVCPRQVFCIRGGLLCPDGQYAFKPCCSCQRCCPL